MTDDVVKIAEGLSEAQRETLLVGTCGVPRRHEEWTPDCICGGPGKPSSLVGLGLAYHRDRFPNGIVRTPLGLAVRQHLQEQDR